MYMLIKASWKQSTKITEISNTLFWTMNKIMKIWKWQNTCIYYIHVYRFLPYRRYFEGQRSASMQNDINCSDKINIIVPKCNLQFDLWGSILLPFAYTKTIFEGCILVFIFLFMSFKYSCMRTRTIQITLPTNCSKLVLHFQKKLKM